MAVVDSYEKFTLYGQQVHWSTDLLPIVWQSLGVRVHRFSKKTAEIAVFYLLPQTKALSQCWGHAFQLFLFGFGQIRGILLYPTSSVN